MAAAEDLEQFEDIRPYRDDEVAEVVARLANDPKLHGVAAAQLLPKLNEWLPVLAKVLAASRLRRLSHTLTTVAEVQQIFAEQLQKVVDETIDQLTMSGIENVDGGGYLFVSNHRDITLDSSLLNLVLHKHGLDTCRMAVGDNLFKEHYAADLMRLNKSFIVERDADPKAVFKVLARISRYIRFSLDEGASVWIAQAEGRSKDGLDQSDPALLRMLTVAYRNDIEGLQDYLVKAPLIPVTVSYELDPCDEAKAVELAAIERNGAYEKAEDEDLQSIVRGITGYKGRVHVHVGQRLQGDFADVEAMAQALDRAIWQGYRIFPTHVWAAQQLGLATPFDADVEVEPNVRQAFEQRLQLTDEAARTKLLEQYANTYQHACQSRS